MQQIKGRNVVENIGQCPGHGRAQEGQAQQDQMHREREYDVGEPDALAIQPRGVRVLLTMCNPHIHCSDR